MLSARPAEDVIMIDHYDFSTVLIDGKEHASDVIYHRGRVASWSRETGHSVSRDDLRDLMLDKPAVLVIGTGAYGVMQVPQDTRHYLEEQDVQLVAKPTGEAVRTFNELKEQGANVAIAMHLTC
jgi:hypothetical protein